MGRGSEYRAVVLPRLVRRFEKGPIDWSQVPALPPVATTLKKTLVEEGVSGDGR